jgi:hypothetical protein
MHRVRQLIDERLVTRARQMGVLTQSVRQLLPPALAPHCWVCGLTADDLTLATDGGAWATQLRYLQREILKHVNAHHGLAVRKVRIRVASGGEPAAPAAPTPRREQPRVPETAGDVLRETARTLEDRDLAVALERLAERAGKRR